MTRLKRLNVPVPGVLHVGNETTGLPYMISEKLPGRPGTRSRDKRSVLLAMGKYAATINSIRTTDYGDIFNWSPRKLCRNRTCRRKALLARALAVTETGKLRLFSVASKRKGRGN